MSDKVNDTVLNSITDNLAESFFEGGASSANVITPAETPTESGQPPKTDPKTGNDLDSFLASNVMKAEDFLGDRLETPTEPVFTNEPGKTPEQVTVPASSDSDFNFIVDDGILAGFEDDTPIKTKEDLAKLITANKEHWMAEAKTQAIQQDRSDLPDEVKFVIDYAKKGGDDLKTVFKLLGEAEAIRTYDIEKEEDQKTIIREYYENLGWSEDETEEELVSLHRDKRLKSQASKFQPKLQSIKATELADRQERQNLIEQQETKARQFFEENVINTLKGGKVGDLKLDKEEQLDLYNGLVREQYQSIKGKTNRLGALLDRIQYVKPDYEHLMEVAMLLSNREGFKQKIREQINTQVTAEQVKKIKTEQQKQKIGSSHNPEKDTKRLPKLGSSFINPF